MMEEERIIPQQEPETEAPASEETSAAPEAAEAPAEESAAKRLAARIRQTTAQSHVTPLKKLKLSPPEGVTAEEAAALLAAVGTAEADPALAAVACVKGQRDWYYYDSSIMTPHFAELDSLLMDKDILRTIATVTRSDCALYPRPTQFSKLRAYPFYFSEDEILGAAARMKDTEEYGDIDVVTASNGAKGFYSSRVISRGYAQGLIEQVEVEEHDNP